MTRLTHVLTFKKPYLIIFVPGALLLTVLIIVQSVNALPVKQAEPTIVRSTTEHKSQQTTISATDIKLPGHPTPTPIPTSTATPTQASPSITNNDTANGTTNPTLTDSTGMVYRITVNSEGSEEFGSGTYVLWIPNGVTVLRGVTTWGPACGGSDLGTGIPHPDGIYLGNKYHLGVIGQSLTHKDGTRTCHETYADLGSGAAFLRALSQFAAISNHAELTNAPIVVEGLSAAGGWALRLLQLYPERIVACYVRAASTTSSTVIPAVTNVPVMLSVGSNDSGFLDGTRASFAQYRVHNGPWSFLLIPGEGHTWNSNSTNMMTLYLDEMIPLRLPASPGNPLLPLDASKGWLGNVTTGDMAPLEHYSGDHLQAAWFPNQRVAQAWQQMTTTGKLSSY